MGGVQSSYTNVDSPPPHPRSDVTLGQLSPSCKVLPVDPRSPSSAIMRTPIVVEKTPDASLDPRSPTPGVIRTPLSNFFKSIHLLRASPSPLTHNRTTSPMECSTADAATSPIEYSTIDATTSPMEFSAASDLSLIQSLSLSETEGEQDILIPSDIAATGDEARQTTSIKQAKPKQLFMNTRSSSTRSPLRAVNNHAADTPTRQVQRRQMRSIDTNLTNLKSCRIQEREASTDKENLRH